MAAVAWALDGHRTGGLERRPRDVHRGGELPLEFLNLGLQVRAAMHTGEMEHGPAGEVRGIAVHTGARVAALAGPGEILVSRTIRDLVADARSGWSRGSHELKGLPDSWEVFAVVS